MPTPELILPNSHRATVGDYRASYIKHWRSQLSQLLPTANLTTTQRANLGQLLDRETQKVFVEGKYRPNDRLEFWRTKQLDPTTLAAMSERAMISENNRRGAIEQMNAIVRSITPKGYELTAEDQLRIRSQMSRYGAIWEIWEFNDWAQNVLKPTLARANAIQIAEAEAAEEARKASADLARTKPKF
jgi:hypothetical protein